MTDKDFFKQFYSETFSKEENRRRIIERASENKRVRVNKKWTLASVCAAALILCTVLIYTNGSAPLTGPVAENKSTEALSSDTLVINEAETIAAERKIDAELKEISRIPDMPPHNLFSDLSVPKDFGDTAYTCAVYVRSGISKNLSVGYDCLAGYEKSFQSSKSGRSIVIQYSESGKPARDYHFENGENSVINNFELKIYKYENIYFTEFYYRNVYIDIEAVDITIAEFHSLLKSIIR